MAKQMTCWNAQIALTVCSNNLLKTVFTGKCPDYLRNIVQSASASWSRSGLRSASSTDYGTPRLRTKFG